MQARELEELVESIRRQKAEGQTVEVKAAHQGCPQKLYDTLSSFSNQDSGGTIVFGLDEKADFALVGVYDLQDLQKTSQSSAIKWNRRCGRYLPLWKWAVQPYAAQKFPAWIFPNVPVTTREEAAQKVLISGLGMPTSP